MSPLGRNFYLNITPNNLVNLYLRTDAVPEGSPTSVTIREVTAKDWEAVMAEASESLSRSRCQQATQPSVTNCVNRRLSSDSATLRTQHNTVITKPMQKQSLSELVTSLRNCSSAKSQAPGRTGLSVASMVQCTATQNSVVYNCHGNTSELNSVRHIQTAPLKLRDQSKISNSNPANLAAPNLSLNVRESQTPDRTSGAKFRFKRTLTTPSPVQSSADLQTIPHLQSSAAINQPGSLMSTSVNTAASATCLTDNTVMEDMWGTGTVLCTLVKLCVIK